AGRWWCQVLTLAASAPKGAIRHATIPTSRVRIMLDLGGSFPSALRDRGPGGWGKVVLGLAATRSGARRRAPLRVAAKRGPSVLAPRHLDVLRHRELHL